MGIIGLAIQLQQNQRAQQLFNAQRAVGQAAIGGIDPVTGAYDPNKTISGIAGNPAAALAAPGGISDALTAKNQNTIIATNQLGLGMKNNEVLATIVAPYANKTLTDTDVATLKQNRPQPHADANTVNAADIGGAIKAANAAKLAAAQTMGAGAAASPVPVAPAASVAASSCPSGHHDRRGRASGRAPSRPSGSGERHWRRECGSGQ